MVVLFPIGKEDRRSEIEGDKPPRRIGKERDPGPESERPIMYRRYVSPDRCTHRSAIASLKEAEGNRLRFHQQAFCDADGYLGQVVWSVDVSIKRGFDVA